MMNHFANKFKFVKTENPRTNFDFLLPSVTGHGAFMTVFQIITTENWTTIMYNCITACGPWEGGLLPIIIVFIGYYCILNLFVAILLSKMEEETIDENGDEVEKNVKGLSKESKGMLAFVKKLLRRPKSSTIQDSKLLMRSFGSLKHTASVSQGPSFNLSAMEDLELQHTDIDVATVTVDIKDTYLRHILPSKPRRMGVATRIFVFQITCHAVFCLQKTPCGLL